MCITLRIGELHIYLTLDPPFSPFFFLTLTMGRANSTQRQRNSPGIRLSIFSLNQQVRPSAINITQEEKGASRFAGIITRNGRHFSSTFSP